MTRLFLTWIALAALPLSAPPAQSGAEVRSSSESTHTVPQFEVVPRHVLAGTESRWDDLRSTHTPHATGTGVTRLPARATYGELAAPQSVGIRPLLRSFRLPEARAPPA